MVEENGSLRGRECVARISSPVRICHPISASASGRFDNGPASSDQKRKMKMMSRTEGRRKRTAGEFGCAGVIKVGRRARCEDAVDAEAGRRTQRNGAVSTMHA